MPVTEAQRGERAALIAEVDGVAVTIGEDSLPAGIGCFQTTRPVFIERATKLPSPGTWLWWLTESTGMTTSPAWPATAGEAAASVPTFLTHRTRPSEVRIALATPSSPSMNIVPC